MDDFVLSNLHEANNEWCARLLTIFTPLIIEGIKSIYTENYTMCVTTNELPKVLMNFQNALAVIPKWNLVTVEEEKKRIIARSGCNYLEDLITCVHVIQLKILTSIRVGNKQKKIDIAIPKLDVFIHKIYINVARKLYMNIYLFEHNITALQVQKNNRELEIIVQECILTTIRESVPTEAIIRAYLDECVEHVETVSIEHLDEPVLTSTPAPVAPVAAPVDDAPPLTLPLIQDLNDDIPTTHLSFNDYDSILDSTNNVQSVNAPKTFERLDEISASRAIQRQLDEADDEDTLQIHTDNAFINDSDILDLNQSLLNDDAVLSDIEQL